MTNFSILKQDINKPWDVERFLIQRFPHKVSKISPNILLTFRQNVLDMPIKMPGDEYLSLPKNMGLRVLRPTLKSILDYEKELNVNWRDYYCYLTSNMGWIEPGESQRNPGAHFDGMQGVKYKNKLPVCHQYLVSSSNPTIYYTNSFNFTKLDSSKHNFFKECDKQKSRSFKAEPFTIYLQTTYNIHESPPAKYKTFRSFLRVEFSLKPFNRSGNTINPHICTGWDYEEQPIPSNLI